jgi:hypothetical protein
MHHQVPCNLAKNEYPHDPDAAMVEYTMGGEHGGNNDNNVTFQDVADAGNTEQPMMGVEQGVNNNDNNMPQTSPPSGAGQGHHHRNLFQDHHLLRHVQDHHLLLQQPRRKKYTG